MKKDNASGFVGLALVALALILGLSSPGAAIVGDLNGDYSVDWEDVGIFSEQWWLVGGCAAYDWCEGADSDNSGEVDFNDFALWAEHWLETLPAPVADFIAVPKMGWSLYYRPEFVSMSTGHITDYLWEFGDDSNSTEMAPNHQYALPGTYTVTLTVSGLGGSDSMTRTDYITVNDFNDYPYSDYVITAASMTQWDSAVDAVESAGGGRILFDFNDQTIYVDHDRDFYGNNLIVDGQDKNVTFYYSGSLPCNQDEGGHALIRIHGDDNIFRNVTVDRFPEGIHLRGGWRNLAENMTTNTVCEDAITMNGGSNYCIQCTIRDCTYGPSEDKTIMVNDGGGVARMVIKGCYSYNGDQPIRMTGSGLMVVRHCEFEGSDNRGPRFGGTNNLVIFENNYSHDAKDGLRLTDNVSAIVRNNIIENCVDRGIRIYEDTVNCWARMENNTVINSGTFDGGVYIAALAQIDLGGGSLDIHRHGWYTGPGTAVVPSVGGNTLQGNTPHDLKNNSPYTVKAEYNFWDHTTIQSVMTSDVTGLADVGPLAETP